MRLAVFVALAAVISMPVDAQKRPARSINKEAFKPARAKSLPTFSFLGQTTDTPGTMTAIKGGECVTSGAIKTCTGSEVQVGERWVNYIVVKFNNNKLYEVYAVFGEYARSPILDALTAKYGPPNSTTVEKWQSKGGATFDNPTATWKFAGHSSLQYDTMGGQVDEGSFFFMSEDNAPPKETPKVNF